MLRACRREIVDQVIVHREHAAYLPTLINALARRPAEVPVGHAGRAAGVSKYPLGRLLALQLDMLATFSVRPLRLLHLIGFAVAAAALLGGGMMALRRLSGAGGTNDVVLALILGLGLLVGALFVALGLIAEIVGRTYDMVRERPRYAVARVHEGRAGRERGVAAAAPGAVASAPGASIPAAASGVPFPSGADGALRPPAAGRDRAARPRG
jgi:undecaprenyl-phosphate 4-deoxy-4-formamido-L-arabinose transferase